MLIVPEGGSKIPGLNQDKTWATQGTKHLKFNLPTAKPVYFHHLKCKTSLNTVPMPLLPRRENTELTFELKSQFRHLPAA